MRIENDLWIAGTETRCFLHPAMANRHGLIAGATGTGKSVTLKVIAESFSDLGVPVFLADIKGDMSGLCLPGVDNDKLQERIRAFGIKDWNYKAYPTEFFDVFGRNGHPLRVTVSEMGPLLLGRMLDLSDVQRAVLSMVFRIADEKGLLLLDLKDLRLMLQYVGDHADEFILSHGSVSKVTVGAIQRSIALLEDQGAAHFFGEPSFEISDWMKTDANGKGMVNILHAVELYSRPLLYSTFVLWLLSELFETLPEVGDLEKPKMIFFFDEAHLLFNDAPKYLIEKVEQVIRLIRSKGVGVYFVTQNPADIPQVVLSQLGNRVQHALRAYTPAEQKNIRAAAQSFRVNERFDTETILTELGTGEALVSFLDEKGVPSVVERALVLPPQSLIGPAGAEKIQSIVLASLLYPKYLETLDRISAYEMLMDKYQSEQTKEEIKAQEEADAKAQKEKEKAEAARSKQEAAMKRKAASSPIGKAVNSAVTSAGREIGRRLIRGILGGFLK
ncbi:MAG: DUF853 family protein [Clostridiales bacterium]|nr:DUF853 family protein [Clostridiales bacterium]